MKREREKKTKLFSPLVIILHHSSMTKVGHLYIWKTRERERERWWMNGITLDDVVREREKELEDKEGKKERKKREKMSEREQMWTLNRHPRLPLCRRMSLKREVALEE